MNIIAAADKNWGIGKDNSLLDHIPEDMKFFRETTSGKAVIMGKNTFLSFPGPKALPNRLNIVLTHDKSFDYPDVTVCDDLTKAIELACKQYNDEDIFIIGGESVYNAAEPFCNVAYITKIDKEYDADRHLADFDNLPQWRIATEEMVKTQKGIYITFVKYVRN